jgi:hypothetical protein
MRHNLISSAVLIMMALVVSVPTQVTAAVNQSMPDAVEPPVLAEIEPHVVTGQVAIPEGRVSITLPDDVVYVPWQELQRILILSSSPIPNEPDPQGVIISNDQFDLLIRERQRTRSREAWELRSQNFLANDGAIEVHWLDGWIDTSEALPDAGQLLSDMQLQAQVINNKRLMGPLCLTFDGWGESPAFNAKQGILTWSLHMGIQSQELRSTGMSGLPIHSFHYCHLGTRGVLRLICNDVPGVQGFVHDMPTADRLRRISRGVAWDKACGFTARQPSDVGERTGGLRHVIQPRILFGRATDELVFHRGLGYAWILILIPTAVIVFLCIRWIKGTVRAMAPTSPTPQDANPRCPACSSIVPEVAARCLACGASLIRRQG